MRLFAIRLKMLLKSRANVFWTFIYPLLLGLFFYMGFGNLSSRSSFATVHVFVASDMADPVLLEAFTSAEYDDGKKVFQVDAELSREELEAVLQEERITGYVYREGGEITYRIRTNGIGESIIKSFLDEFIQMEHLFQELGQLDPDVRAGMLADLMKDNRYLQEINTATNPDYNNFVIYFYALIAMTCMFGSFWGVSLVGDLQADNSYRALRTAIAPESKLKLLTIYFLAALALHFSGNLLLIFYLKYILDVEFSQNLLLIILASFVGCVAGIAMGTFLAGIIRAPERKKEGIMVVVSLFSSALSGLMMVKVKYWAETYFPPLRFINPAGLVTDSFFSLYYFSDLSRYIRDLLTLSVLSILLVFGTYLKMRGEKYDSV